MTSSGDDRRLERLAILGIGTAAGITLALVYDHFSPAPPSDPVRHTAIFGKIAYWVSWSALALAVLWFGRRVSFSGPRPVRALLLHTAGSVVFAFAHIRLWTLLMILWDGWTTGESRSLEWILTDRMWIRRLFAYWTFEWEIMVYWSIVGLAHAMLYRHESLARAHTAARLDAELSLARLQVLQQQMHPHFLFNTLQSISGLMHHSVDAAEQMIERLGELLRGSLRADSSGLVTVGEELQYVGHYLAIEHLNMGDRLTVRQNIQADVLRCRIPRLLLQPLVENAVRHGIAPAARGGTLTIDARRENGRLELTVVDDGVGLDPKSDGAGIALNNTRRRLELLYPGAHGFEILRGPNGLGARVRVSIPASELPDTASRREPAA